MSNTFSRGAKNFVGDFALLRPPWLRAYVYLLHSPCNTWNASLVVSLWLRKACALKEMQQSPIIKPISGLSSGPEVALLTGGQIFATLMRTNEHGRLCYRQKSQNLLTLCTTVTGNEQFSLFIIAKQYPIPCKNIKSCLSGCWWRQVSYAVLNINFQTFSRPFPDIFWMFSRRRQGYVCTSLPFWK